MFSDAGVQKNDNFPENLLKEGEMEAGGGGGGREGQHKAKAAVDEEDDPG